MKPTPLLWSLFSLLLYAGLAAAPVLAVDETGPQRKALKVCADPHYQPFSSNDLSGYENRIATLIGKALNLPVEYTWFPQRMGFIRNTLRKENPDGSGYLCDLVIGVPKEFELATTTAPYMRSTYALVTAVDGKLASLQQAGELLSLNDAQKAGLKIGVTERSPGALWLARHNLFAQLAPYRAQSGDPEEFPGQPLLNDLEAGKIDAAIVWGPTAAYFVRTGQAKKLRLLPMVSEPGVQFDFAISAAVRFGEDEWQQQIDTILQTNATQIQAILQEYGIPLMTETTAASAQPQTQAETAPEPEKTTVTPYADHIQCDPDGKNCKIDLFLTKGFRAFGQCQVCHGIDGSGSTIAPSLLEKLKELDKDTFYNRVENGYQGQIGVMPPWKDNPNIMNNLDSLYAYLKARSDGVIPAGTIERY
ncbi:MAG: quinoprotein dehydrogenase-associated putative ABC transporter substrate-binding protein [Gammaproteobacteria bacterium]|nr:quinoprotein dehydrogenase-associated putative ABC transporter substrate-binding protein [Gammaproteobacteria bacterium]MBU1725636.1 quinoprotein dehydrogenase-associated putative ABC transporter substrate-binding protein [Gammaproteobacteria bacterium]MBU2004012.1 quinoprotein dehydrogenase-associated putative ABC transporter substrate-binding protein [Gammaproteobacteria bacterium]